MSPPLSLTIRATKPDLLAGETVILDVDYVVLEAFRMAYVPLNDYRTRVWIAPRIGPARPHSGRQHRALHATPTLQPLDRWADVEAGQRWNNFVDLAQYRRALPAGRHRVWISYQFGDAPDQTVESNVVDIEIHLATATQLSRRWIPRATARGLLGAVAIVEHGADAPHTGGPTPTATTWVYRVCRAHDPTALTVATRFEGGGPLADTPQLAHPDRHAYVDYPHIAVWTEGAEGLRWALVRRTGRYREIGAIAHGLDEGARLVEPPLHLAGLGLRAIVAGIDATGASGVFLADVRTQDEDDALPLYDASGRFEPYPAFDATRAVALWTLDRQPVLFVVEASGSRIVRHDVALRQSEEVWSGEGEVLRLIADPASESALALLRVRDVLTVWRGEMAGGAFVADATHEMLGLPADALVDVAPQRSIERAGSLVLLLRTPDGWRVLHGRARWDVPFATLPGAADAEPMLVASDAGIALLRPSARLGFERLVLVPEPA